MAVTVGIGIARFAYALVLPDMREDLAWSWSAAGFMNTINAIGYLVGALTAAALIRKVGWSAAIRGGTLACLASLVLCALSGNFFVLSLARLIAGLGAAAAFVAGGALTAEIGHSHPARASLLLALFYSGPGLGILLSGLIAPFTLQWLGPGSWQMVWWVLALLSVILILPVFLTRIESRTRFAAQAQTSFPIRPIRIYLAGYFLFGAGYIAYMTFLIAFVRDTGAGAPTQALLWTLIGLSAFVTPWVCRGVLALDRGGLSAAILVGANALGAAMPVLSHSTAWMAASAFVFGTAFFAVAASTTAFVRFNYPPQAWPQVIAALTVAFSLGQMLGPIAIGAITDALGSLSYALNVSAAILVLSALSAACQRRLR
ncbi:MAG: YbfB/YjiJ family MFS transporter [Alphaproteobacteria bacterium]|nr:YbfB/YjiJ family MFS transporter [Alphaproteobacteria bacterium]